MIPAHTALYQTLPPHVAALLASRLLDHGLVDPSQVTASVGDDLEKIDGPTVARWCADLSHAQVVLCLARETSPTGMEAIELLLKRPIYMCARGETGEVLTDIEGRPLPLPLGHRRGEPPRSDALPPRRSAPRSAAMFRRDPRIIVHLAPNPKQPSSASYARYAHYRLGMTVEQARIAGVTSSDIEWDLRKGFIKVALPQDIPADFLASLSVESTP